MKKRILAAAVLIPVLFVILYAAPKVIMAFACGIVSALAAFELLHNTGLVKHFRLVIYAAIFAFLMPVWYHFGAVAVYGQIGILLYFALMMAEVMASGMKLPMGQVALCTVGALLIPYFLSALVRIMEQDTGRYLILVPFVVAFLSDTGGYFIGCRFGKHRLAPVISPKKSVEGLFGGIAFSVIGMVLYVLILGLCFDCTVNYGFAVIYGLLGSLAGVFGDLCFSAIKRQTGIKDYGNLIPGHGGALDRFDSIVVAAPLIEILLCLLPVVTL